MNIFFSRPKVFISKTLHIVEEKYTKEKNLIPSSYNIDNNFYFSDSVVNESNLFFIQNSDGKYITLGDEIRNGVHDLELSEEKRLLFTVVKEKFYASVKGQVYSLSLDNSKMILRRYVPVQYDFDVDEIILVEPNIEDIKEKEEICNVNYIGIIDSLPFVTPVVNLQSIINSRMLYSNKDRIRNGIYPESGHGDANEYEHLLCDANTNFNLNPKLLKKCVYGIGITLGVLAFGNDKVGRFDSEDSTQRVHLNCCLYFSVDFLRNHYYHVNQIDNMGFYIYDGVAWGGYSTTKKFVSFDDSEIRNLTPELYYENYEDMEILVKESIPIEYLQHVKFGSKKDYDYFKEQLDELGVTSDYLM